MQGAAGVTYVSAVYADSVAARDGRLKPGDRLIKVTITQTFTILSTTIFRVKQNLQNLFNDTNCWSDL